MDSKEMERIFQRLKAAGPKAVSDMEFLLEAMQISWADHEKAFAAFHDGDLSLNEQLAISMGDLDDTAVGEWMRVNTARALEDAIPVEMTEEELEILVPILARLLTTGIYNGILAERGMQAVRAKQRRSTARQSGARVEDPGRPVSTARPSRSRGQRKR